jgi:hypothetical protein
MVDLRIDINDAQLEAFRRTLDEKRITRAARRAGNDALEEARRAAVDYIRSRKRIKQSTIERRLDVVQASNRASLPNLRWGMRISNRPISVGSYPSEQTPHGVVAEVNVGSSFRLRHAFIRVVRNGFRGVFERQGPGAARYPLKSIVASGVADVMRDPEAGATVDAAFKRAVSIALLRYLQQEGTGGVP